MTESQGPATSESIDARFDVFLSYNSVDGSAVVSIANRLKERGVEVFLDRWHLVPGQRWLETVERTLDSVAAVAIFVGREGLGDWQNQERFLALERQSQDEHFPVIPVLLPGADGPLGLLRQYTWVDLRGGIEDDEAIGLLMSGIFRKTPEPRQRVRVEATRNSICPYRGLSAFREEDAPYFYGRSKLTAELIATLDRQNFVAVVGASGCGKSSVVRAGLLPYLRRTAYPSTWEVATLVPGPEPLHSLASALAPVLETSTSTETARLAAVRELERHLASGIVRLSDVSRRILDRRGTDRFLLFVDQWEELYTAADKESRENFIRETLDATSRSESAVSIVITMRGDFVNHALESRELADRLQHGSVLVGPMSESELEEALIEPATRASLEFESGLTRRLMVDVGREPGRLPLLAFVLAELWKSRRNGRLLHRTYDAMGGVRGALATKAEEVLESERDEEPALDATRRVFLQLIHKGADAEITRRRARVRELGVASLPIVRMLAEKRLLVIGRDPFTHEDTVELAHETLIRNWPRLRMWVDEDREFLLWRQRLRAHRTEWEEKKRDEGALLRGAPLEEATRKRDERGDEIDAEERGYIEESMRVERIQSLSRRALSTLRLFLTLGVALVGSGYVAEKAYRAFLNVRLDVSWTESFAAGLSVAASVAMNALPFLVVIAILVPLIYFASSLSALTRFTRDVLDRKGCLLAVQLLTFFSLLYAVLAHAAIPSVDLHERVRTIADGTILYEKMLHVTVAALLGLLLIERWRRRLGVEDAEARFTHTGCFALSLGISAVVVVLLILVSIGHGSYLFPQQRLHELVTARFSDDVETQTLRGRRLELIRLRQSPEQSTFYCAVAGSVWEVNENQFDVEAVRVDATLNLMKEQLATQSCEAR